MARARRRYAATTAEFSERVAVPLLWILARGGKRGLSLREISHLAVISDVTARRRLRELQDRGLAVQTKTGRWVSMVILAPVLPLTAQQVTVETHEDVQKVLDHVPPPESPPERRVGDVAARLANQFSVPAVLDGLEVSRGLPPRPCTECGSVSVLKYGVAYVCPRCARAWESIKEGKISGE